MHKAIIKSLSPMERKVIPYLKNNITLKELVKNSKIAEVEATRAIQFLQNKKVLSVDTTVQKIVSLGNNGKKYLKRELPERIFLRNLKGKTLSLSELKDHSGLSTEEINVCIGLLKSKAAIDVTKDRELKFKLTSQGEKLLDKKTPEEELFAELKQNSVVLDSLQDLKKFAYDNLKKRKDLIQTEEVKTRTIILTDLGGKLIQEDLGVDLLESLTPEMIKTGAWKEKEFRTYDIKCNVPKITGGARHPYSEGLNLIRKAFLEMGFQEMEGPWVETAFWNMDSMWIPQDHPAREVQDTFYLDRKGDLPKDAAFIKKIKAAHENGYNTGSKGHTTEWDPEVAKQLLLRTHSTATTYRYFYKLKLNENCKYFYLSHNFRNEAIDATHLPELGQSEGFIMADDLTLSDLMGFVKAYYEKLGITKVKFKPTFNPYTEPSMECHYYNEKMGKWYALINSGIFRPEALAPYGITKKVLAWGMGSSRMAAVLTGKLKLKDLLGPEVDLEWIKKHKRSTKL